MLSVLKTKPPIHYYARRFQHPATTWMYELERCASVFVCEYAFGYRSIGGMRSCVLAVYEKNASRSEWNGIAEEVCTPNDWTANMRTWRSDHAITSLDLQCCIIASLELDNRSWCTMAAMQTTLFVFMRTDWINGKYIQFDMSAGRPMAI